MRIGAFVLGLVLAALLFMLETRVQAPRSHAPAEGLIARIDRDIATRVESQRQLVRPVRGNLSFVVNNFDWKDPGHPDFVHAREVRGRLDARALGNLDFIVRGVVINGGETYVEQNAAGEWNFRRALDRMLAGQDTTGPGHVFTAFDVAIQNARVRVVSPVRSFGFDNLSAQLTRVDFTAPTLPAPRVAVSRATALLVARDSTYPIALENGRFEFPVERVNFAIAAVRTGETRVTNLTGVWTGALLASGNVEHLKFEDVRFLGPRVPKSGTASFSFEMTPVNSLLTQMRLANADIRAGGSHITGSATVLIRDSTMSLNAVDARFDPLDLALVEQIMGDTLPYRGTVSGTARGSNGDISFDVNTRLLSRNARGATEPIIARVTGSGQFASNAFDLRRLEAQGSSGIFNGRLLVTGSPNRGPLHVSGRVAVGTGAMLLNGTLDMSGRVPRYDLQGRLLAVNLQQLTHGKAPPASLTARVDIEGSGFNPDSANARIHVEGRFTGWRAGPRDTLHAVVRVNNGTLSVDSAAATLATMSGSASGSWHFAVPASGAVRYALNFDPITPFGPYVPFIGDEDASGNLALEGSVTGARGQTRLIGSVRGSALAVGEWSASSLESRYDASLGAALPQFVFDATARNLRTPTAGEYESVTAKVNLTQPQFSLDVRGNRPNGAAALEIVAGGTIPSAGARQLVLQRARIDLGRDNWMLTKPATFAWDQPGTDLSVHGFEMRKSDGSGLALIEGKLLPLANADFRLETSELPVGDIQRLLGRAPRVSGALTTKLNVMARAGVPQMSLTYRLDSAVVENVRFSQLSGDASYLGQKLTANTIAVVDTAGALRVHADLPMNLRFGEGAAVKMLETGDVRITLLSDSIALAPLATLLPGMVDKVHGSMSANIVVSGTVQEPVLDGSLYIRNAAMFVVPSNQTYDSVSARIRLQNREAVIEDFRARAGGSLRVGGTVTFNDLTKPVLDLQAVLARFQPVGVDNQPDAAVSGQLTLNGPMRSATLTGALRMEDGYFPVPASGNRALDAQLADYESDIPTTDAAPAPFYTGLIIDNLRLTAGPNLWFTMIDARAELNGELSVDKHGDDMRIVGDLTGERGTYVLRAGPIIRRLDVVQATVRFRGEPELNPALDITARRRIIAEAGRELNIDVHVGGTMQSPTLSLASQEAVTIQQSELLSFLLFGQPSFAIGGATTPIGDQVLTQTLLTGAGELASMELEQRLLDQLGMSFDVFQIRLGGSRLNTLEPSLVVGQEITRNVFLTVETAVSQLFGNTGTRAYTTYAVRLEWRMHPTTTLRASYEPVNVPLLRGYTLSLPTVARTTQPDYQKTLEIRRRWLW